MFPKPWLFVSLVAAISGTVQAAAAESGVLFQAESLDENGDGAVTTEEFEAHMLERWAENDLNEDGKVTQAEMKAKLEERRAQRFQRADVNHDGVLEHSEARHLPEDMFARLDTDHNGTLSQVEFDSVVMLGPVNKQAGMAVPALPGDEDHDGAVTRAEALTMAQELSTRLDANGDGVLNRNELGPRGLVGAQGAATSSALAP